MGNRFNRFLLRRIRKHFSKERNVLNLINFLFKLKPLQGYRTKAGFGATVGALAAQGVVAGIQAVAGDGALANVPFVSTLAGWLPTIQGIGNYLMLIGLAFKNDPK